MHDDDGDVDDDDDERGASACPDACICASPTLRHAKDASSGTVPHHHENNPPKTHTKTHTT